MKVVEVESITQVVANKIDREFRPFWVGLVEFKEPTRPTYDTTIVIFPNREFSLVCDSIKIMPYQNVSQERLTCMGTKKVNSTDKDKIVKELL